MTTHRLLLSLALIAGVLAAAPGARASDRRVLDDIFADWYASQGGLGTSELIHSFETQETVEMGDKDHTLLGLHVVRTVAGPFRFEITRAGSAAMVQAYDGKLCWQYQPDWGIGLTSNVNSNFWVIQNDLLFGVRAFRPRIDYRAAAPAVVNGHDCIVAAATDADRIEGRFFFDRKTRKLIRLERFWAPGSSSRIAIECDDYRPVGGLSIPFMMKIELGGAVAIHRRSRILINPPVDPASFVLSTEQLREAVALGAIVQRHDATVGRTDALARLHTRVARLTLEISTTGTKTAETVSQKEPNRILVELVTPGMGRELRGYDGTTGWIYSELEGYRPLKPAELGQLQNEGSVHLVGRLEENFPFRRRVGERIIHGRPTVALALASQQGPAGTFYFDKENSRLLRIGSPIAGDRENSTESTIDFSDFRTVDGVEYPFVSTQTTPLVQAVSTVLSLENNVPLKDEVFRPKHDD